MNTTAEIRQAADLADNLTLDYYLETFPSVNRGQVLAVLRYGQERIEQELAPAAAA